MTVFMSIVGLPQGLVVPHIPGMSNEPFFVRDGARLIPHSPARSFWNADALHGRVIAGILGAEIERLHGEPAFMPARLTVDMHRAPGLGPLEVVTTVARDGKRIRLVDAELISNGQSVSRASCQFLARGETPPGRVWTPPEWSGPKPQDLPQFGPSGMNGIWEVRFAGASLRDNSARRGWLREVRELVGGESLTPFARVATGADWASPVANTSDVGLGYINSDLTLYLSRLPVGEWIGYESSHHVAHDGIATGGCFLYDEVGRIGSATVCALAQGSKHVTPTAAENR
jgi:hypothetical protein